MKKSKNQKITTSQNHSITKSTLNWLKQSIEATGLKGSAAYYSRIRKPLRGWERAYPETTGYIIETLLDYYKIQKEDWLREYALSCADWLCDIQLENGAFAGLLGDDQKPSTFNTGQIIFGLVRAYEETKGLKYWKAFERAVAWLVENMEPDGTWKKGAYVSGFVPSYNTRVVWAMLFANRHLKQKLVQERAEMAFDFYSKKILPNGAVKDWSFAPGVPAFTHTIAYTLRGFWECEALLGVNNSSSMANSFEVLAQIWHTNKRFAGSYDQNWNGNDSFICVTGNAQISILFSRLFQITQEEQWQILAKEILTKIVDYQRNSVFRNLNGAIPGSVPFWGEYMRFKYPNWAAKFFLDACRFVFEEKEIIPKSLPDS